MKLWKNELVKLRRQTANKVMLIIALVLVVLIPIILHSVNTISFFGFDDREYYQQLLEEETDPVQRASTKSNLEFSEFMGDNGIAVESWLYREYSSRYMDTLTKRNACQLVVSEGYGKDEKERQYFSDFFSYLFAEPEYYGDAYEKYSDEAYDYAYAVEMDSEKLFETVDFEAELAEAEKDVSKYEELILTGDIREFAANKIEESKQFLEMAKAEYNEVGKRYGDGKAPELMGDFNRAKAQVEASEYVLSYYEALYKASHEDSAWMYDAIQTTEFSLRSSATSYAVVGEKEFSDGKGTGEYFEYASYDDYVEDCEKNQRSVREAALTLQYSLQNSIPTPDFVNGSTKDIIHSSLDADISVFVILLVILSANCIANEYTAGTIRLLLIRPRTRSKIIVSKFLALFTVCVFLCVSGFVLTYLTSIAVSGVKDAFAPDLMYSGGVVEVPALVFSVLRMMLPLISGLIILSFAFMMSVISRKSTLAIVIPFIIMTFSSVIQMTAISIMEKYSWLKYTVLPYLNLGDFLRSPIDTIARGFNIFTMPDVNILFGIILVSLHAILLYFIGIAVFRKQEIKN